MENPLVNYTPPYGDCIFTSQKFSFKKRLSCELSGSGNAPDLVDWLRMRKQTSAQNGSDADKSRYGISSLQRGLKILSLLSASDAPMSATQISRSTKLHGSTVHRFLVNLEQSGFVSRDRESNYRLGSSCISLGCAALKQLDTRRASLGALQELNRLTRETIHLTIRNQLVAVYIEKFDSPEPLRIFSRVGASVPLHCTAVGKIFLAYLAPEHQAEILEKLELKRFTANSICSLKAIRGELLDIKRLGYAIDNEEHELHIKCIAGPIFDIRGDVVAAFSITGPAIRMHKARIRELIPLVRSTSMSISENLGYGIADASMLKA